MWQSWDQNSGLKMPGPRFHLQTITSPTRQESEKMPLLSQSLMWAWHITCSQRNHLGNPGDFQFVCLRKECKQPSPDFSGCWENEFVPTVHTDLLGKSTRRCRGFWVGTRCPLAVVPLQPPLERCSPCSRISFQLTHSVTLRKFPASLYTFVSHSL